MLFLLPPAPGWDTHSIASASPAFPTALMKTDCMKTNGRDAGFLRGSSGCLRLLAVTASHGSHLSIFVFLAQTSLPLLCTSFLSRALHTLVRIRRFSPCLLAWAKLFTFDDGCFPLVANPDLGRLQDGVPVIHRTLYWAVTPPNTGAFSFPFLLHCYVFQAWDIVLCTCLEPSTACT